MSYILQSLKIAKEYAKHSKCSDKQVGCVLLSREGDQLSEGINWLVDGSKTCDRCKTHKGLSCPAIHAEINAIINLAQSYTQKQKPYILVSTLEPCIECTKALINLHIKEVYYESPTSDRKTGRSLWNNYWREHPECRWQQIQYPVQEDC